MVSRDSIRYRPVTDADIPFIRDLYATTRDQEMNAVSWTAEEKRRFLDEQCDAQKRHYDDYYTKAEFLIIEKDGRDIGRFYFDRADEDWCLIDIALLPELRGSGIGTMLIRELMDQAAAAGKPVSLYVEYFNPAKHLYDRLGFQPVNTNGVYYLMLWRPDADAAPPAT
jgi:ribosomal protein S18 acetylase RimI-like enzyme